MFCPYTQMADIIVNKHNPLRANVQPLSKSYTALLRIIDFILVFVSKEFKHTPWTF